MNTENDRELLKLAAKAAEIDLENLSPYHKNDWEPYWNPLRNDGHALRLAVKLRVDLIRDFDRIDVVYDEGSVSEYLYELPTPTDPYAATRRAIVRAAAAIGREMK